MQNLTKLTTGFFTTLPKQHLRLEQKIQKTDVENALFIVCRHNRATEHDYFLETITNGHQRRLLCPHPHFTRQFFGHLYVDSATEPIGHEADLKLLGETPSVSYFSLQHAAELNLVTSHPQICDFTGGPNRLFRLMSYRRAALIRNASSKYFR